MNIHKIMNIYKDLRLLWYSKKLLWYSKRILRREHRTNFTPYVLIYTQELNFLESLKDNHVAMNEAWASQYWAIGVLEVVGRRRNCTGLKERVTGERPGEEGWMPLGRRRPYRFSTTLCQDWWYCLYPQYRDYSFISRYSDWLMNWMRYWAYLFIHSSLPTLVTITKKKM